MRQAALGRRTAARLGRAMPLGWLVALVIALVALAAPGSPALALKSIVVTPDQDRIEITTLGDIYESRGDSLQIETVGGDGVTSRMTVGATTPGTNPNWLVFALSNPSDKAIERWLTAERYTVLGSGAVWPDLDARRIEAVTPSLGFVPERIKSDRADVFRITLEPGQTITYVTELASDRLARVYLWKPLDYELKVRERQLVNGIMLGATGLLAVFLTAIFAANHKIIFPASALVAYCVLAYLCIDFGFFHKLFQLRPEETAVHRAAGEAALAASLVIFLYTFLRLGLGNGLVRMVMILWIAAQLSLVAVAVVDPRLAATFARLSLLGIGGAGALLTFYLALRGQDRALSLIPSWLLFLVWLFLAGVILGGRLSGDMATLGLAGGLVVILLIIGVTVTQYAFRSLEPLYGAAPTELQTRSLALDGAGAAVWEWNARRDEVKVHPMVEAALGLAAGELSTKVEDFTKHLHVADRERFRLMLWSIQERSGGRIRSDFRLRSADNSYRWFELEAASVPSNDRRAVRCVGLIRDVTEARRSHERLLHDAVHDSLTGLPNRELFVDRLGVAMLRARSEPHVRPTVLVIDIDKFRSANAAFGLVVGDSLLLTIARRLQRHLGPQDTLARIGGDQFAILFVAEQDPRALASLAERIRRSLRSPIKISGKELVVTGSLGIAVYDGEEESQHDLLKEAEMAMFRAKRGGADRIEIFSPEMRGDRVDRAALAADLRKALEKGQIKVLYQPIVSLATEELAGFEAFMRWEHPKAGMMNPAAFVPVAEESDLIGKLGAHVLMRAAQDAARWHKELPRPEAPLFVSVNIASRQLFRQDLIQEIRHILGRAIVPKGSLRLEVSEALVMENPEQATEILQRLRAAGAELALDDFGAGYSALSYLERLPFDTLKIDGAVIKSGQSGEGDGSAMIRSIVALAHELERKVVAQGIEGPDEVSFLRSIGCEYAQGFYYGEPMPDRDVLQLLKLVKKSERKLQPRGFFRAKPRKGRPQPGPASIPAAGAAQGGPAIPGVPPTLSVDPAKVPPAAGGQPAKNGKAHPPAALPGSTMRARPRPVKPTPPPQTAKPVPSPAAQDGPRHPSELVPPAVATPGPAPGKAAPAPAEQLTLAAALAGQPPVPMPPPAGSEPTRVPRPGVLPGPLLAPPPPPPPAARAAPPVPAAAPTHLPGDAREPPPQRTAPFQGAPPTPAQTVRAPSPAPPGVTPPAPRGSPRPAPDFSTLPPSIAESLARLAGISPDEVGPKPRAKS